MSHYRHYPAYCPSGIPWLGDIPKGWDVRPLKRLANAELSNVDKLTVEGQSPVRLCNYVDVYKNERIVSTLPFMEASASNDQIRRLTLREGDVLITKDSETPDDIGIPALVDESMDGVVCGYHLGLLRPEQRHAIGGYIQRVLQSAYVKAEFFCSALGLTRYGLSKYDIESLKLPVPPLAEQIQITAVLDRETTRIDALIDKKTEFIELLAKKRQALITHAVTKGLDPRAKMRHSGVEWIGEVPEHWIVSRLKYVAMPIIGLTYAPEDVVSDGSGTLVLRSSNIQDGKLDLADTVRVKRNIPSGLYVREGDILVCSRNGSRALIGKNIQLDSRTEGATFGAFMTIIRSPLNDFLYFVFNSTIFDAQAGMFMTSTVNQLTVSMIENMEVAIPPADEWRSLVAGLRDRVARIKRLVEKTEHSIDLLKQRRSALITAAVTGQIDLRESA